MRSAKEFANGIWNDIAFLLPFLLLEQHPPALHGKMGTLDMLSSKRALSDPWAI